LHRIHVLSYDCDVFLNLLLQISLKWSLSTWLVMTKMYWYKVTEGFVSVEILPELDSFCVRPRISPTIAKSIDIGRQWWFPFGEFRHLMTIDPGVFIWEFSECLGGWHECYSSDAWTQISEYIDLTIIATWMLHVCIGNLWTNAFSRLTDFSNNVLLCRHCSSFFFCTRRIRKLSLIIIEHHIFIIYSSNEWRRENGIFDRVLKNISKYVVF
jgi:hypothetical protein